MLINSEKMLLMAERESILRFAECMHLHEALNCLLCFEEYKQHLLDAQGVLMSFESQPRQGYHGYVCTGFG